MTRREGRFTSQLRYHCDVIDNRSQAHGKHLIKVVFFIFVILGRFRERMSGHHEVRFAA